ncbi:uncharacterized protein [Ptychodera flava]|uniref:uncharacterized protein n=1 Tax=Ptychodera flava TaxID=63121 RepID=UPI00396A1191
MSMSIPDCMNGETPAKRQKTNATSAGTTSNLSEDFEGKTYNCPSLLHLCVGVVASEYSSMAMHIVSSTTQLSDSLYTKITSMAFPTDEETIRLCCGIANVSSEDNEWDKGEELLNNGDVGDVVQSGFAVSATIHEDSEEWEDLFDSLPVYVYLNFERKILTSMRCSRCEVTFCRHQVAATLYRIRRADEVPKYKPVAEVLSTLGRNQLQTLLQYVISDDPATLMFKSFQHIGQDRESTSNLLSDASEKFLDPTSGSVPAQLNYHECSVSAFAKNLESLLRKCEPYFQLCSKRCCYHKLDDYSYHKPDCEQSHIVLCLDKIKEVSRFDSHLAKELICKTAEVIVTVTEDVAPNTAATMPDAMRAFYQDFCDWSVMAIFQALPLSTLTEVKHRLENLTLRQHQVKKLQELYQALTLPSLSRRFDDETPILENYSMASTRQGDQSGDKEQPYTLLISLIDYVHFQSAFDSLVIVNDIPLLAAYTESCLQFRRTDKFIASVVDLLSAVIKAVRKFTITGTTILKDYDGDERHKIRDSEDKIMSTLNVDGEDIDMHWLPGLDFEHLPSWMKKRYRALRANVITMTTSTANQAREQKVNHAWMMVHFRP